MTNAYKILLIEPDIELAKTIVSWLEKKAEIVHVTDNEKAQEQAAFAHWNLVITDINVPEINDLDITQIVKKTNSSTAILIITENIKVDFILTAMRYHADGILFKPLNKQEFLSRALELAEESRFNREKDRKIILAIGAHPDDVEYGCAGTLAKLRADGNQINILTLSLGAVGGKPRARKREAEKAAELQEAQLYLGNLSDTKISNTADTIQFIEKIVDKVKPTDVYTHSFCDSHQDHRNIYQATITACRHIPNLFSYLSPSTTVDFRPNIFININEFMEEKLNIINAFKSQISIRPYLKPEFIKAIAIYWGSYCNYNLAEPMEVIKKHS